MHPTSSEIAHAEDYRTRHAELEVAMVESAGMAWCQQCDSFQSTAREVRTQNATHSICRDCYPFDHPCECGKDECLPGTQECLACAIAEDLRPFMQARLARALYHVFMGFSADKMGGAM